MVYLIPKCYHSKDNIRKAQHVRRGDALQDAVSLNTQITDTQTNNIAYFNAAEFMGKNNSLIQNNTKTIQHSFFLASPVQASIDGEKKDPFQDRMDQETISLGTKGHC